jgi:enhancer of polycomb-like protein
LKGAGASTDNEIPVPPPQQSEVDYDALYPRPFIEPRNYIKFSETVEETLSSLYDMTLEDDEYLRTYNSKRSANQVLSENDFERIMELFEQTAAEQAPFAAVDNTVVSYEVMAQHMAFSQVSKLQTHTKQVYEYWKTSRQASGNKPLHPSLKFETHTERDDLDPYVCFRRREVRQTRKTRARDVQIAEKLKKLRKELEDGRQLVVMSQQREYIKRELLNMDRLVFELRAKLKERKVRLGIKTDDEDLYNTKPQKRKISEVQPPVRGAPNTQLRLAVRIDGKPVEQDLPSLAEKLEEKEEELRRELENKVHTHKMWNQNHLDLTDKPLPPAVEEPEQSFRAAKAQFLPTPPASASDNMELDEEPGNSMVASKPAPASFEFSGKTPENQGSETAEYRRRVGRGGRLWVDRRVKRRVDCGEDRRHYVSRLASPPSDVDDFETVRRRDRSKYDQDDSDDEQPIYQIDPFGMPALRFRQTIPPSVQRHFKPIADGTGTAQVAPANRQALPQPPQPPASQAQQPQPAATPAQSAS